MQICAWDWRKWGLWQPVRWGLQGCMQLLSLTGAQEPVLKGASLLNFWEAR
jgi:hypothetical protein